MLLRIMISALPNYLKTQEITQNEAIKNNSKESLKAIYFQLGNTHIVRKNGMMQLKILTKQMNRLNMIRLISG